MNILVSGCSFTHWPAEPGSDINICWPRYLSELLPDSTVTNVAEPAAGNQYISESVIRAVLDRPGYYDKVLVMWSGVSRLDFLTDISDPSWHDMFDQYGFYRRVSACPNELGYIFSGGFLGPWQINAASRRLFENLYKVSNNLSLAHTNLMAMVQLQAFLQSKKISYGFMSYVNYWQHTKSYISPNGDFGVLGYPALGPIISDIDFDPWIFSDADKNGIYEMAKEANDYHGDRFHPGARTNQLWAELVFKNL
jgi:hypothetical protein